jgi:hypothetical protein
MSEPRPAEWHWLWDAYVVGLCVAAMAAVVLLDHRFHGNAPVAVAALAGIVVCVMPFAGRVVRAAEMWRTAVMLATVFGLWIVALWASPVAFTAIPAFYPLIFATLPLGAALVITTVVNLIPLAVTVVTEGIRSPDIGLTLAFTLMGLVAGPVIGIMIMTSIRQRQRLGSRERPAPRRSGKGWRGRSTTPWRRGSPALSRWPRPSNLNWTTTPRRPSGTSS